MTEIVWEDPPTPKRGNPRTRGRLGPLVDELKTHPGKWAIVHDDASTAAPTYLKKAYPGIEAVSRNYRVIDGRARVTVYARWPEDAER